MRRGRPWFRPPLGALLIACIGALAATGTAVEGVQTPEKVKAAFLFHFGSYVEWPPAARRSASFTIAVLGAPEIAAELRRIAPGRTVRGLPVRVREIASPEQLGDARILFIGTRARAGVSQLVRAVEGRPVLVVTDARAGLEHGAMINFTIVDRRVRFEVSVPAAKAAGLELSSRLLSVALRVEKSTWLGPGEPRYAVNHAPDAGPPGRRRSGPGTGSEASSPTAATRGGADERS